MLERAPQLDTALGGVAAAARLHRLEDISSDHIGVVRRRQRDGESVATAIVRLTRRHRDTVDDQRRVIARRHKLGVQERDDALYQFTSPLGRCENAVEIRQLLGAAIVRSQVAAVAAGTRRQPLHGTSAAPLFWLLRFWDVGGVVKHKRYYRVRVT